MNKALNLSVAAALLSGCGRSQLPLAPSTTSQARATHTQRFRFTGRRQNFTVPKGVTQLTITADGASGGGTLRNMSGGRGGLVRATVTVTPGENLAIFVGGEGGKSGAAGGSGGFNGGGGGGEIGRAHV